MIQFSQDENKCNICGSPEIKFQSHNLLHSKHRIAELHRCISRVFYELRVCVSPTHYRSSVIQYFKLLSDVLKIHDGIIPDGMVLSRTTITMTHPYLLLLLLLRHNSFISMITLLSLRVRYQL